METKYFAVDKDAPDKQALAAAAGILASGGLVAFPTETVYGLGANGLDTAAVKRIYAAKGRPADNPLILHIADAAEVEKLARRIPANARALMDKYWPGPLTIIFERTAIVPDAITGGLDTVAVRLPDSVVARELIRLAGIPIAAPSANTSGRPSPTTAQAVLADLDGRIDAIIDAGACDIGVESTVVDCTTPVPTVLRPGGITLEMLQATLGEVELDRALAAATAVPRAPGMKYTHYAPVAPLILVEGDNAPAVVVDKVQAELASGRRVGVVASAETIEALPAAAVKVSYGRRGQAEEAAAVLYQALRYFDDHPVDIIYAEGLAEIGLGLAVMNRLRKAAGYHIIYA